MHLKSPGAEKKIDVDPGSNEPKVVVNPSSFDSPSSKAAERAAPVEIRLCVSDKSCIFSSLVLT